MRLLFDHVDELVSLAVSRDAHCLVYLSLDFLNLTPALYLVPISRPVCHISNLLRFLVWFTVVISVEDISVVYGQLTRLLLSQIAILILIQFDLTFHLLKDVFIDLRLFHKLTYSLLIKQLFHLLWRQLNVLLLKLLLDIKGQLIHIMKDHFLA